jgi:hypothetical protein
VVVELFEIFSFFTNKKLQNISGIHAATWQQKLATETGSRNWQQKLAAETGSSNWQQKTGSKNWQQKLAADLFLIVNSPNLQLPK